ncbi:acetyltransferase (the isoleucine patch superfamily) protein [Paenibacillus alvei TS-15]|jgi:sugar O-acyltransferase (sialic acid O-acetyltransferase NeuD family)|uniref:Acetyltransferase (The isoleucine patch superfamily) protein n=1 Tax=Paenibacillus alvei TS-15 TaxID=1117108 RepID=S9TTE0_PAEAL|nr:acetyltransferase [Paenibacillus alvei]EPY05551.1 acetyltransferase (the isoleucine patch superfamily) protein [Paenibacillus alvei TS-15]
MRKIIIWGAGGHAREVNWLCEEMGVQVLGFLDERPEMKGQLVNGVPVLGTLADIEALRHEIEIVCTGVGAPALKKQFTINTIRLGFRIADPLIHPRVRLSRRNIVGQGSMICEGAILTDNIRIGCHVIINRSANISHDTIIDDYVTIAPGVNLAGNVTVGEGAYIGIGSSVREKCRIGCWSIIGGGAFVKDDIPDFTMAAGVPAVIKKRLDMN